MKTLLLLTMTIIASNSFAAIVCHTPRMNKTFEINDNKISFIKEDEYSKKREIASVISRNKNDFKGMTKIVDFENQKHIIHIENSKEFSDANDYLIVKNKLGHEVTYPLTCNMK